MGTRADFGEAARRPSETLSRSAVIRQARETLKVGEKISSRQTNFDDIRLL